jgi:hypothetical protein
MSSPDVFILITIVGLAAITGVVCIIGNLYDDGFFVPIGEGWREGRRKYNYNNKEVTLVRAFLYDKSYQLGTLFPRKTKNHGDIYNQKRNKD